MRTRAVTSSLLFSCLLFPVALAMGARSAPGRDAPIGQDVGVTAAGDDSDKGKTPCELLGGQPPAGPVYLIEPTASAEVGGRVRLKAGVGAKTQGQPPAGVVKFKCQEQGGGVHGPGDWLPCNGSPEEGTGPVWDATVPEHGEYVFSGPWLSEWQNGLGENPARTHNGPWKLRAEHWIGQTLKTSADIQVTLGNPTVQVHCEGNGALGGLPDVFLISPLAEGEGPTEVDLQWTTENADLPTFDGDPQPVYANVFVHEIVTGSMVACFLEQDASDTLEWDGTPTDEEGNPATGTKVPRGVYYSTAAVRIDVATNGYPCASEYMTLSEMSATPGEYEDDVLPLEVDYTIHDTSDLDASLALVRVYNCSPDNDGYATAIASTEAPTDLGEDSVGLELPALEGCPYYVIISATDDHAELPMPDGEREHSNRPAQPRGVMLVYTVDTVYPNTDGPIYMSDHIGSYRPSEVPAEYGLPAGYVHDVGYADSPLLLGEWQDEDGGPRHCQPVLEGAPGAHGANTRNKAWIEASTVLDCVDTVEGNDATTMGQRCGGCSVYFTLQDPDSRTLWDGNGAGGDDNVGGAPMIDPDSAVSAPVTFPVAGDVALASTVLQFPDQGGDNYQVAGSPYDPAHYTDPAPTLSGTLEAWRLVYYERDSMPAQCAVVVEFTANNVITVDDPNPGYPFQVGVGTPIVVFDATYDDLADGALHYHVGSLRAVALPWGAGIEITLQTGETLHHPFSIVRRAGVCVDPNSRQTSIDTSLLEDAFARHGAGGPYQAFTAWAPHPGQPARGMVLGGDWSPDGDGWGVFNAYFDAVDHPNTVQFVDGYSNSAPAGEYGRTNVDTQKQIVLYADIPAPFDEGTVHECGHVFALPDYPSGGYFWGGHEDHEDNDSSDGCVMIYNLPPPYPPNYVPAVHVNNMTNHLALFGGVAGTPGQPIDLSNPTPGLPHKEGIAKYPDPL